MLSAWDSVMGQWSYGYDNLNRLTSGSATGQGALSQVNFTGALPAWSYDPFGNRTAETWGGSGSYTVPANTSATFALGTNQMNGASYTYDAAGDVTYDGINHYQYDAEGRICAVQNYGGSLTGYVYDAAGIRVAKGSLSTFSCNFSSNGFQTTTSWVLGPGPEGSDQAQVTEYAVSGGTSTWVHTNAFASGALLATYHDTDTYFALEDWLGTKRVEVSAGGCYSWFTSMPYGNGLTPGGNCVDATEQHFTGKEHDQESGNDYFEARYYSDVMGRFMSPDWSAKEEPVPYAKLDDPQTLNLYSYVRNNPLSRVDSDGHQEYVAVVIQNGKSYEGTLCGNHECVAYVKEAGGFTTQTKDWKAGPSVLDFADKGLPSGTAIMLADKDGHYPTNGARHAAEFVQFNRDKDGKVTGITVREQWAKRVDPKTGKEIRPDHPVATRPLPKNNGKGNPIGDASQYHILMIPKPKEPK